MTSSRTRLNWDTLEGDKVAVGRDWTLVVLNSGPNAGWYLSDIVGCIDGGTEVGRAAMARARRALEEWGYCGRP